MPIRIPDNLPAGDILNSENIFVMYEDRAYHQDIRPLKIAILNIMPTKETTETQLFRLLGNTPLQVEITLLHPASHVSKNTSAEHLLTFYKTFEEVKDEMFDGLVITGAPVEQLPVEVPKPAFTTTMEYQSMSCLQKCSAYSHIPRTNSMSSC